MATTNQLPRFVDSGGSVADSIARQDGAKIIIDGGSNTGAVEARGDEASCRLDMSSTATNSEVYFAGFHQGTKLGVVAVQWPDRGSDGCASINAHATKWANGSTSDDYAWCFWGGRGMTVFPDQVISAAAPGDRIMRVNGTIAPNVIDLRWTSPAYSSDYFTGVGWMTWTVAAGDVTTYQYFRVGTAMTINFAIDGSSVGGQLGQTLRVSVPAGKIAAKSAYGAVTISEDGGASTVSGVCRVPAAGSDILISLPSFATFAATSNHTCVWGSITLETTTL